MAAANATANERNATPMVTNDYFYFGAATASFVAIDAISSSTQCNDLVTDLVTTLN